MIRHALSTRLWHWINAASVIVLFMSGLTISNAHRYLYWGDVGSSPAEAWASVMRFPDWMTIPGRYDLAEARDWHNISAWVFALALLVFWITIIANRHFVRDLWASAKEWHPRAILGAARAHLKGDFDHGKADSGSRYGVLQRIAYGLVLGVMLPLMVFTGLAISPGIEPAAPWLVDMLGGRQSARSIHFITAFAILGFFAVHLVMVLLTRPLRQIAMMLHGRER
jgi:thiosulfate reductase cytochrome b subunit